MECVYTIGASALAQQMERQKIDLLTQRVEVREAQSMQIIMIDLIYSSSLLFIIILCIQVLKKENIELKATVNKMEKDQVDFVTYFQKEIGRVDRRRQLHMYVYVSI